MRANPPALALYPWQTRHELRYADMDANGHINNGCYGAIMESNRAQLMFGPELKVMPNATFVLARFEIDYLKEMRWPGEVIAASGVISAGGASFLLRQAIFQDGVCTAHALSTAVVMDTTSRRAVKMSDALRAGVGRWGMRER